MIVAGLVGKISGSHVFGTELWLGDDNVARQHPQEVLELIYAVLPENSAVWPYGAGEVLKILGETRPSLRSDPRFIELQSRLR
jgi:hypothetical protein